MYVYVHIFSRHSFNNLLDRFFCLQLEIINDLNIFENHRWSRLTSTRYYPFVSTWLRITNLYSTDIPMDTYRGVSWVFQVCIKNKSNEIGNKIIDTSKESKYLRDWSLSIKYISRSELLKHQSISETNCAIAWDLPW